LTLGQGVLSQSQGQHGDAEDLRRGSSNTAQHSTAYLRTVIDGINGRLIEYAGSQGVDNPI
jgi:hypothetical protein